MDESFENLPGVVVIVADILVLVKLEKKMILISELLCKELLIRVSDTMRKNWRWGWVRSATMDMLSADGLHPDPMKISVIKDMPPPENRSELITWFGMVNYLGRFCHRLSEVTNPLSELLGLSLEFYWGEPPEAFNKVKEIITQELGQVLSYYDPAKSSCLLQEGNQVQMIRVRTEFMLA